jgi:hypothetical protein
MVVSNKLPGLISRIGEAHPVYGVIEASLKENEEVGARNTLLTVSFLEIGPELFLSKAVHPTDLLLFTELKAVVRVLASVLSMLSRWIVATLNRTLIGIAAVTLKVELHGFTPANAATCTRIASQD